MSRRLRTLPLLVALPLIACTEAAAPQPPVTPGGDGDHPSAEELPPGDPSPDAGSVDAGARDAGTPDAGAPDAGTPDAGPDRDAGVPPREDGGVVEPPPRSKPEACAPIFDDSTLQTFEVTVAPEEWAALQDEHVNAPAREDAGLPLEPYHPLTSFRHGTRVVTGAAMIRLRGNPNWWSEQQKMQFQVSFNETNPDARFRGLRKIVLDSGHYNTSYLRDRLAMSIFRDLGLPAPCVNHARLMVNGQYYGLYTHVEKVDREFLERNFDDPDGNLYKKGEELKTNEDEHPDTSRSDLFWASHSVEAMEALGDLDQWVRMWAVEALIPDADGYWAGGWNFYLYDHPEKGFLYLPWDIDLAFDKLPADTDPLTWHKQNDNFNGRPHVEAVLADPVWRKRYIEHVARARKAFKPDVLQERIDTWAAQIEEAARADTLAPWSFEQHRRAVQRLRNFVDARASYIDTWLECHRNAGDAGVPCAP
jgi:hypothetical protein